jgi:hypothetical protein
MTSQANSSNEIARFQATLLDAIHTGDAISLQRAVTNTPIALLLDQHVPVSFFDFLLATAFGTEAFELRSSSELLMLFAWIWHKLLPAQCERFLASAAREYGSFRDPRTCGVLVELIGDHFQNRRGLRALNEMRWVANDQARAMVPHGYMHLVTETDDEVLARNAAEMVLGMADDPSERVRDAVRSARAQLERLGYCVPDEELRAGRPSDSDRHENKRGCRRLKSNTD